MPSALCILNPGAEEIEYLAPCDVLVRAGVEVTTAGSTALQVMGARGLPLAASRMLAGLDEAGFDLLLMPGGMPSAERFRDDPVLQDLLAARLAAGRLTAIICASPLALLPQGLARGRRLTSYPSVADRLQEGGATWLDRPVVEDGCLVTSQGPGTAIALGLHLAARLCGPEVALQVAQALLVPWSPDA